MLTIWLLMFSSTSRETYCPFLLLLNEMSTMKWTPILGPEAKLEKGRDGGHDDDEDETED